jgi:chitin synthase
MYEENQSLVNTLKIFLLCALGVYIIPILIYCILFKSMKIIIEILAGFIAFIYYVPSYLNILNIYALCRIDDISWGTKGL